MTLLAFCLELFLLATFEVPRVTNVTLESLHDLPHRKYIDLVYDKSGESNGLRWASPGRKRSWRAVRRSACRSRHTSG